MSKLKTILLVGAGAVALWYLPTIFALQGLSWKFGKVRLTGFASGNIQLSTELILTNSSFKDLMLQYGFIEILLNNTLIGVINNPAQQIVKGNSISPIVLLVDISPETTGTVLYNAILSKTLLDFRLLFRGQIRVNDKNLPVEAVFTKADISYA